MDTISEKRGKVIGLATSEEKGTKKSPKDKVLFIENEGIESDAHRNYKRQVSLLSMEERDTQATRGPLSPGDCAENVLIEGIRDLSHLSIGTRIKLGEDVILEITEIGKEHTDSPIHKYTGKPVLPVVGVFCKVIKGGWVRIDDEVEIL